MTISMYQASIPVLNGVLANLAKILEKAESHAAEKKIDPAVFVQARLYPNMYPLARQVQIATDVAKGCGARLAGQEPPKFEDNETTFAELQARIAKTITFLGNFTPFANRRHREKNGHFYGRRTREDFHWPALSF